MMINNTKNEVVFQKRKGKARQAASDINFVTHT